MKKNIAILILLSLFSGSLDAKSIPDADLLISRMEDVMRGKQSAHFIFTMTVRRPRWDRAMKGESWDDRKKDASFIRILSPSRDAGTAFLKAEGAFRQYIPRIRRTVRISKSMMLQSWMGSDFSNDDLARDSSYSEDYNYSTGEEAACDSGNCYHYTLTAKEGAPVVWPRLEVVVRNDGVPVKITNYNARGESLTEMRFEQIRSVSGVSFPFLWTMRNLKQEGQETELRFESVEFDRAIPASVFTTRNLTKGN